MRKLSEEPAITMSTRLPSSDHVRLTALAKQQGMKPSAYLRRLIYEQAFGDENPQTPENRAS